jgi:hypothetical protein
MSTPERLTEVADVGLPLLASVTMLLGRDANLAHPACLLRSGDVLQDQLGSPGRVVLVDGPLVVFVREVDRAAFEFIMSGDVGCPGSSSIPSNWIADRLRVDLGVHRPRTVTNAVLERIRRHVPVKTVRQLVSRLVSEPGTIDLRGGVLSEISLQMYHDGWTNPLSSKRVRIKLPMDHRSPSPRAAPPDDTDYHAELTRMLADRSCDPSYQRMFKSIVGKLKRAGFPRPSDRVAKKRARIEDLNERLGGQLNDRPGGRLGRRTLADPALDGVEMLISMKRGLGLHGHDPEGPDPKGHGVFSQGGPVSASVWDLPDSPPR